jgi:hypothetical protein
VLKGPPLNAFKLTTIESSHLFQNAAGFEIVGGQFVLGDVHNHAVVDVGKASVFRAPDPDQPPQQGRDHTGSRSNTTGQGEVLSESELYCSQLLRQRRGFPLYVPGPQRNLPDEYQRSGGVSIGDVGRITPDGIFDFFFNIYLAAEHPINANDVPADFSPLSAFARKDVLHVNFAPGNYVASPSIQKLSLDRTAKYVYYSLHPIAH